MSNHGITTAYVADILGDTVAGLIKLIVDHAVQHDITLYMVGGGVRDLLLSRRTLDIDFMIDSAQEGEAIRFAETLRARFGGDVTVFKPFGTAKWRLDQSTGDSLGLTLRDLPDHVDFSAARGETYTHPGALPTIFRADLKTDLARRDFTINTLAIQLTRNDTSESYPVIDLFDGVRDLNDGVIRVLHDISFTDDPTRIFRAARFEHRFGFQLESHTANLMSAAVPIIKRVTGERLRNEIMLLLKEHEPERALLKLNERGVLHAIHPALIVTERIVPVFEKIRTLYPDKRPVWAVPGMSVDDLYLHLIAAYIDLKALPDICTRLLIPKSTSESLIDTAQIVQNPGLLSDLNAQPSQITADMEKKLLDVHNSASFWAAWLCLSDDHAKNNLAQFASSWRYTRPSTTGETLKQLGLKPGKCYGIILNRLRAARLDGEVKTDNEEHMLIEWLIEKEICRDHN